MRKVIGAVLGIVLGVTFMACVTFGGDVAVQWFIAITLCGVVGLWIGILSEL